MSDSLLTIMELLKEVLEESKKGFIEIPKHKATEEQKKAGEEIIRIIDGPFGEEIKVNVIRIPVKTKNTAEKFEGNLIIYLNNRKPKSFTEKDYNTEEQWAVLAKKVIDNIGRDNIAGEKFYKVKDGQLSKIYISYDVKKRTSKADIASNPDTRISVKKKNASLLSAENNETRAIFYSIYQNLATKTFLDDLKEELSKKIWNSLDDKGRREKGNEVVEKIEHFVSKTLSDTNNFKKKYLFEAMSGENRFKNTEQKANKLLIWDQRGNGEYHDLKEWCEKNSQDIKFDVRWRGENRSGGVRLDEFRNLKAEFDILIADILKDLDVRISNIPAYAFME